MDSDELTPVAVDATKLEEQTDQSRSSKKTKVKQKVKPNKIENQPEVPEVKLSDQQSQLQNTTVQIQPPVPPPSPNLI